jgi:hypothetical protein
MGIPVKLPDAREMIEQCLFAKIVPYVTGPPACGKSAVVHQMAEDFNLKLIDLRLAGATPEDMTGYARIHPDQDKAGHVPMDTFPVEGDPLPINPVTGEAYSGWLLFLDELPLASDDVLKACYKPILDHMVGIYPLHERLAIVAAGNRAEDNAMAGDIDNTALLSRMAHIETCVDVQAWLVWARANGVDYRITSFIEHKPDLLFKFDPDNVDVTFASPRTWEFTSRLIKTKDKLVPLDKILLSGVISEGVAREFYGYTQLEQDLPKIADIVADPLNTEVPRDPSCLWMITGILGHYADENNIKKLMQYINRIAREFQFVTMREVLARSPTLQQHPALDSWLLANGHDLF